MDVGVVDGIRKLLSEGSLGLSHHNTIPQEHPPWNVTIILHPITPGLLRVILHIGDVVEVPLLPAIQGVLLLEPCRLAIIPLRFPPNPKRWV
jgi:hypothetical protein